MAAGVGMLRLTKLFNLKRCFQLLDYSRESRGFNTLKFSDGVFTQPFVWCSSECQQHLAGELWINGGRTAA